jgi:hypothetical protein
MGVAGAVRHSANAGSLDTASATAFAGASWADTTPDWVWAGERKLAAQTVAVLGFDLLMQAAWHMPAAVVACWDQDARHTRTQPR